MTAGDTTKAVRRYGKRHTRVLKEIRDELKKLNDKLEETNE